MRRATALVALLAAGVAAGNFRTMGLGKKVVHAHTRSRVVESLPNGSSIPADGSVWPTAIYWATVQVGTPPQNFPAAIDSGSGDLDISGKGCDGCVTSWPNNQYDASASSTSKGVFPYSFSNTYQTCDLSDPTAPCTISGKLYSDKVHLAGLGPVDVTVGSIEKQTSNFDQFKQIDGVIGFTMGSGKNVFAQLVKAGLCENIWAMCMYQGQTHNGTLTIGGVDTRLSDGPVNYVPDVGLGFHSVKVESLLLNGHSPSPTTIGVGKSAILDTGTNVLLLPSSVMSDLQESMCLDSKLKSCNDLWTKKCVTLTADEIAAYPPLSMKLDGLTLDMSPEDYLLFGSPQASSPDQVCLGIRDGGSAGGSGFIIGDTTMRNYYLVFDLEGKKIGWGKVNAKTCGSL